MTTTMKTTVTKAMLIAAGLTATLGTTALAEDRPEGRGPIQMAQVLTIDPDRLQAEIPRDRRLQDRLRERGDIRRVLCPNPAVLGIQTMVISQGPSGARVRLMATVKNLGGQWSSQAGQQSLTLTKGREVLARTDFPSLRPGETRTISWVETTGRYGYGEFPPVFRARISYDPDIYLDRNERNDDCRRTDNVQELSGTVITALLSR